MFEPFLETGILKRAQEAGLLQSDVVQIRDFAPGARRQVDDGSYGGGPGMVMKADVLGAALDSALATGEETGPVIYMSPQGRRFTQADAQALAEAARFTLICGRYEGVDERFIDARVDDALSIGDFVLTGGEIPAMTVMDAVVRLLPGALGDAESAEQDSFQHGVLDHPHYTRPLEWEGRVVPATLRSGHHAEVAAWRRRQGLLRTLIRRPDLIPGARLSRPEKRLIQALYEEIIQMEPRVPETDVEADE